MQNCTVLNFYVFIIGHFIQRNIKQDISKMVDRTTKICLSLVNSITYKG